MEASLQYRDTTQSFKYTSSEEMIVKVNEVHYGNLVKRSVHGACVSTNKNTVKGTTHATMVPGERKRRLIVLFQDHEK
jgi:uncharacterized protein YajQ (UPF0234 family)